jgi:F/Y-rich N-terminus/F/Y rich C-terminus
MLDRIAELESVSNSRQVSSAYPTLLKSADLPAAAVSHLRQALEGEDEYESPRPIKIPNPDLPPPREPESSRQAQQPAAEIQFQHVAPTTASGSKRRSRRKAQQPYEQQVSLKEEPSNATIVSAGGTRLKIKPPTQPTEPNQSQTRHESMVPPPEPPSGGHSPTASLQQDSIIADRSNGTSTPQSQARGTPIPASSSRATTQRSSKLKEHTVTAKTFSVPMIPRDPQTGDPVLPLTVGIMTVISLGQICLRDHFHTKRYIFPVGYEVTRRYLSTVDPIGEVTYHCKILEGLDGPIFRIKAPDIDIVEAGTANGAWSGIVKTANRIRNRQHSNSVSGPDYFGLGENAIKHLIQGLPDAERLRDYVWQKYVEGGSVC